MRRLLPLLLLLSACAWVSDERFQDQIDPDGDGVLGPADCDDDDDSVTTAPAWYPDTDGDGDGAQVEPVFACDAPVDDAGNVFVLNADDCDDGDDAIHANTEWWTDADDDQFGDPGAGVFEGCDPPEGFWVLRSPQSQQDCDDGDPAVSPGATEICERDVSLADQVDTDCDGNPVNGIDASFTAFYPDTDRDSYGDDTASPTHYCTSTVPDFAPNDLDCDDTDATIYVGAPDATGDGIDQDCGGEDGPGDGDNDGWPADLDCDATDGSIYPDAPEVLGDGIDQNCDGIDGIDVDGDGFAARDGGFGSDCDDTNDQIKPGVDERCDTIDWDCDLDSAPGTPTVTLLDASRSGMVNVTASAEVAADTFAIGVCGKVEGFQVDLPNRDFEILGMTDTLDAVGPAVLCPLRGGTVQIELDDPSASHADATLELKNLQFGDASCATPFTSVPFVDIIADEGGRLVLRDITVRDIGGPSTDTLSDAILIDSSGFTVLIDDLTFDGVDAETLARFGQGSVVAESVDVRNSTVGSAGLQFLAGLDPDARLRLDYPTTETNTGTGPLFDVRMPSEVTHARGYEQIQTFCSGPDDGGGPVTPRSVVSGVDHTDNGTNVFEFHDDVTMTAGAFGGNERAPIVFGFSPSERSAAALTGLGFVENSDEQGGAIHIQALSTQTWNLSVSDSIFQRNVAVGNGGAISGLAAGFITSQFNLYCSNAAGAGGGGVYVNEDTVLASTGDVFEVNRGNTGGALQVEGGVISLTNTWFGGNTALNGAGNVLWANGAAAVSGTDTSSARNQSQLTHQSGFHMRQNSTLTLSRLRTWNEPKAHLRTDLGCYSVPSVQEDMPVSWIDYLFCAASNTCTEPGGALGTASSCP